VKDTDRRLQLNQAATYRIKVRGRLEDRWSSRFDDMAITVESDEEGSAVTTLTGEVADQAALHGLLARIRDLGLPLLLVQRIETP
jgi:hypothetical protein